MAWPAQKEKNKDLLRVGSNLVLPLFGTVEAALQVLQQVEHLLDLGLSVSHVLHHVLQLHHAAIRFFLEEEEKNQHHQNLLDACRPHDWLHL